MSNYSVPFIAPWAANFNRYAVQVYTPQVDTGFHLFFTPPSNTWLRVVYLSATLETSAAVANRVVQVVVTDPMGHQIFDVGAPVSQPASTSYQYMWAPGLTSYANTTNPNAGFIAAALPDVIWARGATIDIRVTLSDPADFYGATRTFALETYTEQDDGTLQQAPVVPTPVLA